MFDVSHRGSVAIVEMRHGRANALDTEFCDGLTIALNELQKSASAIIVTARGSIFSAGVDLVRAIEQGPGYFESFLPSLHRLYEAVFYCPKPIIAAINGHAVAGGCVLACATDWRVMTQDSGRIGVTELLVGLPFPALAFEIMRFVTAPQRFEEVIFTGATFPPEAGFALGLVNELAPAADVIARALAAAERMAALSPPAFALTKRQSRQPVAERMATGGTAFEREVTSVWQQADSVARMRDYVERILKKR